MLRKIRGGPQSGLQREEFQIGAPPDGFGFPEPLVRRPEGGAHEAGQRFDSHDLYAGQITDRLERGH
ncbi:hypothetical protein NicSoilE8_38940 [Arthrobacter sp. NicSoilE8]|nr:hypothetical protein AUT26_19415 [Arthrobacter sp. ATCC 21022]KUR65192.1 hypothetical protein JM67_07180 [Arthrobacter sp. ATCC 21022]BCW86221.1 hypothetical protein NicSoilE8_38940 [Arthrobacter sp. NicSoilE8]